MRNIFGGVILRGKMYGTISHPDQNPEIILVAECDVLKEPLDEYYRAVFGFVVNKVPSLLKWFSIYCSCN